MLKTHKPPLLAFVGFSGSGKTTLLEKVIAQLRQSGIKLALIKHAHHDFDIDIPGKDSYRLRHSGASQVIVASRKRRAHITETPEAGADPDLASCVAELDSHDLDLILVEGFKQAALNKVEVHRKETGHPYLYPEDDNIIALISNEVDNPDVSTGQLPLLDINKPDEVVDFIIKYIDNTP